MDPKLVRKICPHPTLQNMMIKLNLTPTELGRKVAAMTPEEWNKFQLEYMEPDKGERPN